MTEESKDDEEKQQGDINDEEKQAAEITGTCEPVAKVGAVEGEKGESKEDETKEEEKAAEQEHTSTHRVFPKSFYDPVTNEVMMEPVVAPNGDSYEKNSLNSSYYPNRALKAYIEHEVDRMESAGSMRGKFMQINESLRTGFQKLLEQSAIPSGEYRPLPEGFYCPISFDLIHDPVIDPGGHTFERAAIHQWIRGNGDSPITRNPLQIEQLYDNTTLLDALLELTEGDEEDMIHPSIRRWKTDESERKRRPAATTMTGSDAVPGEVDVSHPSWPSTREELDTERRRNQRTAQKCTLLSLTLALGLFILFFPSATLFVVFFGFLIIGHMICKHVCVQ